MTIGPLRVILILLLGAQCAFSATTYTAGFTYNSAANSFDLGGYSVIYPLGTLSANDTLSATFSFPGIPASSTKLASLISNLNSDMNHGLQYLDTSSGAPVLSKAYSTSSTNRIVYPTPTNPGLYRMTHKIGFPPSSTQTSAQFFVILTWANEILTQKLLWYTLQIDYYPTSSGSSVGSLSQATTLLKVTDFIRGDLVKLIFVSEPNKFYNFTTFPGAQCTGTPSSPTCTASFTFNIYTVTTASDYASNGFNGNELTLLTAVTVPSTESVTGVYVNNIAHYTYNFTAAGFYIIQLTSSRTDSFPGTFAFQSDAYACPYNPDFGDYFSSFQPCTRSAVSSGLPCAVFDPVSRACSLCIQGYTLVNNTCLANTTCPPRQYYSYGACLNVSSTCGAFDSFTGACLNCSDPANYDFNNGSCTRKSVTCLPNQWQSNYTCFNASITCATFDPNTGKCLTCISNLYQLNNDGSCTLIVVNCPQGQYAVGLNCVTIPV